MMFEPQNTDDYTDEDGSGSDDDNDYFEVNHNQADFAGCCLSAIRVDGYRRTLFFASIPVYGSGATYALCGGYRGFNHIQYFDYVIL